MKGGLVSSVALTTLALQQVGAWISAPLTSSSPSRMTQRRSAAREETRLHQSALSVAARKHGQDACFLPIKQLEQDYFSPRIVQIAGGYPGITKEDFLAVSSEPSPEQGQWTYDFSDPDGPQLGTVAMEGSQIVHDAEDPVVVIAEHFSIGVELPKAITEAVDLIVFADRAKTGFDERKFLVVDVPGEDGLVITAYPTKNDMPEGAEILGRVEVVQIPWLPSMAPTKMPPPR